MEIRGSGTETLFYREPGPSMFGREFVGVNYENITSWFAWFLEIGGFETETLFCGESAGSLKGEVEFITCGLPWFSSNCSKWLGVASSFNNEVPILESQQFVKSDKGKAVDFSFQEIPLFERILCEPSILPIHLSKLEIQINSIFENFQVLKGNASLSNTTCLEIYTLFVFGSKQRYPLCIGLYPMKTQGYVFVTNFEPPWFWREEKHRHPNTHKPL